MILAHTKYLKTILLGSALLIATSAMAQAPDSLNQDSRRAAFDECLSSLGIEKPVTGQRPPAFDENARAAIDACMQEKGFAPPPHRGDGHGQGPRSNEARGGAQ